jgi:hypothetical protein
LKRRQRERKRWSARGVSLSDLQRRRRRSKRERRKGHLAEIHLNFENSKI